MAFTVGSVHTGHGVLGWRGVLAGFALLIGLVWGAGLLQDVFLFSSGAGADQKIWILDADSEEGVLTWVSVVLLFHVAALLFANGQDAVRHGDHRVLPWFALSALFGIVSFDEFYGLHERLSSLLSHNIGGDGIFHFAWAAPLGVVALLGLWGLMPFLNSLGRRTGGLALVSAALYLAGAVGMEMVAGLIVEHQGQQNFLYRLLSNLEEGLEVAGVLLFIYTLLRHQEITGRA